MRARPRSLPALAALAALALTASASAQTPAAEVKDAANVSLLRLNTDAGLVVRGTLGSGAIPATGAGVRLMWHPAKAAFRAGYVNGAQWDDANVGDYSVAFGYNATASGVSATALGIFTMASGDYALAAGRSTTASGSYAFAMGGNTTASGDNSTAMGSSTTADADYATAMGGSTTASGAYSTAMGNLTRASGPYSTAMGYNTTASGGISTATGWTTIASADFSTAMGYGTTANGRFSTAMGTFVSAGGWAGVFMIGDASASTSMSATAPNRFVARFHNGYVLYTSADLSTGVVALNGANSWSSISDSTRKTGFVPADGEAMLAGLARLRLGSWSYRGRPSEERHYGPMAQDFFREFGRDGRGVIGNDTLLATADVDGVLFVAARALEARTARHRAEVDALRAENASLADRLARVEAALARLTASAASAIPEPPAGRPR